MTTIRTWVRGITTFSLVMALILTVFLLSGTTSTGSGIRALYNTELKYDTDNDPNSPSSSTAASASASASAPSSSSSSNSTPTSSSTPTPTSTSTSFAVRPSVSTAARRTTTGTVTNRVDPSPSSQQLTKRVPAVAPQTARATILISYFGICTHNTTTPWKCASRRAKNGTSIPSGAPPDILELAASLQGALSPLPAIFSIVSLCGLLTYTILLSFLRAERSSITSFFAQGYLFLALIALALSVLTAVLFQASSTVAYAIFSTSSGIAARKSVAGLAVAWAAVFFTCLAVAGAWFLVVSATQDPEGTRRNALAFVEKIFGHGESTETEGGGQENIHPALMISHPIPSMEVHPPPRPLREDRPRREPRRGEAPFIGGRNMI